MKRSSLLFAAALLGAVSLARADYDVIVTGSAAGTAWGSAPYTSDSDIAKAAVHAGLVSIGQTASIHVSAAGTLDYFPGSTANGVTTVTYQWPYSAINLQVNGQQNRPATVSHSAPATVYVGTTFTVTASCADPDGNLSGMCVRWQGMGIQQYWPESGSSATESVTITAPSTPCTINIRAEAVDTLGAGADSGWQQINVVAQPSNHPPSISLSFSATTVQAGDPITVTATATDDDGNLASMGIRWQTQGLVGGPWYVSGSTATQSITVTAPATPGTLYFRGEVFDSANAGIAADWQPVVIVGASAPSVVVTPASVPQNGTLVVNYSGAPDSSSWIGLYPIGAADSAYISQSWVPRSGSGTVTFSLSASFTIGQSYEARLMFHDSYVEMAASSPFVITAANVTHTLTVQNGSGGASGLSPGAIRTIVAAQSSANQAFVGWSLFGAGTGTIGNFAAATTTFTMGNSDVIVRANFIGLPAITVSPAGPLASHGTISVQYQNAATGAWVGIYRQGASNQQPLMTALVSGPSGAVSFQLTGNLPGNQNYEARLLQDSVYTLGATSNVFSVVAERAPDILMYAPTQASVNDTLAVGGTVTDSDGDLRSVTVSWKGSVAQSWTGLDGPGSQTYAASVNAGAVGGAQVVLVQATDARYAGGGSGSTGYAQNQATVNILAPNSPPAMQSASASLTTPGQVQLTGSATDVDNNLARLDYYISYPPAYNGYFLVGSKTIAGGSASATFTWNYPSGMPGTYRLLARAYDSSGAADSTSGATAQFDYQPAPPSYGIAVNKSAVVYGDVLRITYYGVPNDGNHWLTIQNLINNTYWSYSGPFASSGNGFIDVPITLPNPQTYNARLWSSSYDDDGNYYENEDARSSNFTVSPAPLVQVTINGGAGAINNAPSTSILNGLSYGQVVTVSANSAPAGQAFTGWAIVGTGTLANAASAVTTFAVGNTNATLTANFAAFNWIVPSSVYLPNGYLLFSYPAATGGSRWVGVFTPGAPDTSPLMRMSISNFASMSTFYFTNGQGGTYELRLFQNDALVVRSNPFTVATAPNPIVTTASSTVQPGGNIQVSYAGVPRTGNWFIGVYRVGWGEDSALLTASPESTGSGTVSFSLPATTFVPGVQYNVRMVQDEWSEEDQQDYYTAYAFSSPFSITPPNSTVAISVPFALQYDTLTVSFQNLPNSSPWIGLYKVGTADTAPLVRQAISSSATTVALPLGGPLAGQTYEVRLFYGSGDANYYLLAKSSSFLVVGQPVAAFTPAPATGAAPLGVSFNGSASTAPGSTIQSYAWDFDGDGAIDATGVTGSRTFSAPGTYVAKLTITNAQGVTGSTTRNIVVSPASTAIAPTVTIAGPTSLAVGQQGTWTLLATDPNGNLAQWRLTVDNVTGSWQSISAAGGAKRDTYSTSFPTAKKYTLFLEVQDSTPLTGSVAWDVTVTPDTTAPAAPSSLVASNVTSTSLSLAWSAPTDDVGVTAYEVRRDGVSLGTTTARTFSVANLTPGTAYSFSVLARDAAGNWSVSATVSVSTPTVPPVRLALQYWRADDYPGKQHTHPEQVWVGGYWWWTEYSTPESYAAWDGVSSFRLIDPNGHDTSYVFLGYAIVEWHWSDAHYETQDIVDGPPMPDGLLGSSWTTTAGIFDVNSAASGFSVAPINRGALQGTYQAGQRITFRTWGLAPNNNCDTYQATLYSPSGSAIGNGSFHSGSYWETYFYGSGGIYRVEIKYLNAGGGASPTSGTVSYYISVGAPASQTITFPQIANHYSNDAPFALGGTAASGLPVTYSVVSGPATINGNTLTISGIGTVMVRASQAGGLNNGVAWDVAPTVDRSFTVTAPPAPLITSAVAASGTFGAPFTYQISGSNTPNRFAATGLPGGLAVDAATGRISGTPTQVGTFNVVVFAINDGGTGIATLNLQIGKATPVGTFANRTFNAPSVLITAALLNATFVHPQGATPAPSAAAITYTMVQSVTGNIINPVGQTFNRFSPAVITASFAGDANYLPATISATFSDIDTDAPTTPTDVTVGLLSPTSFVLKWSPSTDNSLIGRYAVSIDDGAQTFTTTKPDFLTDPLTTLVVTGLQPNTAHSVQVTAIDYFGNQSVPTTAMPVTTPASVSSNAQASKWADVNGDGILDEIVGANASTFYYYPIEHSSTTVTYQTWSSGIIFTPIITIDGFNSDLFIGAWWTPDPDSYDVTIETVRPGFEFVAEPGYKYLIALPVLQPDGTTVLSRLFPPAVFEELGNPGGVHVWDATQFWPVDIFTNFPAVLVRLGQPLGGVQLNVPGVGLLQVQIGPGGVTGDITLGGITLHGASGSAGSVTLPGGISVSVASGGGFNVAGIPGVGVVGSGSTVNLGGGVTLQVDASGHATLTIAGGPMIALSTSGGGFTFPNGIGLAVDLSGKLNVTLPPGSDPILAQATDIFNKALQSGSGVIWSTREIIDAVNGVFGPVLPVPTTGPLNAVDLGVTANGRFQLGARLSADGPILWFNITAPLPQPRIAVDANRDGSITFDQADQTSQAKPYRFWINDDFDAYGDGGPPATGAIQDCARDTVNGTEDLKDFFPVFLEIKNLLQVFPPGNGVTYKLKQADGAVKFAYTNLTRATAFAYKSPPYTESTNNTFHITAEGVPLIGSFLNAAKDKDQGVLMLEGIAPTTQPLVLIVERNGVKVAETSLSLSLGARILLLLHGMNSSTDTWTSFVADTFGATFGNSTVIRSGNFVPFSASLPPKPNQRGVRCYLLQFGAYESTATARQGLEGVKASNSFGQVGAGLVRYLSDDKIRCGDFEPFEVLGREVSDAIDVLLSRHRNAQILLLGHSRGGLSARAFLETDYANRSAVIGLLTTASPHRGSRLGLMYNYLNVDQRNNSAEPVDWKVVDFLLQPTTLTPIGTQIKTSMDVRRPIFMDVQDPSASAVHDSYYALDGLNDPAFVAALPTEVSYGEIVYNHANFGLLSLGPKYSVVETYGGNVAALDSHQLGAYARSYILNGNQPGDQAVLGDGLIPATNQTFTSLPSFPQAARKIPPRIVDDHDIVHTEAPSLTTDLIGQLRVLAPDWFP